MMVPVWTAELAAGFWREAGEPGPFPRDLREPILRSLPLSVTSVANLSLLAIKECLQASGLACVEERQDRRLRAGLFACQGHGIVFLNSTDSEAEQRFSLAHELAHFLRDFQRPRQQVASRLGPASLQVMDGLRPPTPEERLQALLCFAPLGVHCHLLERDDEGRPANQAVAVAENDADRLAYELLAPAAHVNAMLAGCASRARLEELLVDHYGLPALPAASYAACLIPTRSSPDPLLRQLRLAMK